MAKLYFRFAVMNAGKSTQLLQIAYDYEHNNNKKILCLKPGVDTKQEDTVTSRLEDGLISRKCDFLIRAQGLPPKSATSPMHFFLPHQKTEMPQQF